MEKLQFECEQYKLYSPDSLKYITDNMHQMLLTKIDEFKSFFSITDCIQFQINYFDDLEKFRNFIYKLRGEKESLPKYAQGTYDLDMVNAFISPDIEVGTSKYKTKLYMASHELFHIMYMKYILNNDYSKRIVWYDEGMALFMSGERDELLDLEKFKDFYIQVKSYTKKIPNLNEIIQGDSFCNEYYNGYNLSYLSIRYLSEVLSIEEFKNLMGNFDAIKKYGKIILSVMFNYFDNKFKI